MFCSKPSFWAPKHLKKKNKNKGKPTEQEQFPDWSCGITQISIIPNRVLENIV